MTLEYEVMAVLIYKIVHAPEWAAASGNYMGSDKDRDDGFLHFSTAEQIPGTLARHYAGVPDLVLVAVDETALGMALKYEPSRDGALFPHLYGPLPLSAVTWARPIPYDAARGHIPPL
jgi:uncharacterized protein (DUF952 family)